MAESATPLPASSPRSAFLPPAPPAAIAAAVDGAVERAFVDLVRSRERSFLVASRKQDADTRVIYSARLYPITPEVLPGMKVFLCQGSLRADGHHETAPELLAKQSGVVRMLRDSAISYSLILRGAPDYLRTERDRIAALLESSSAALDKYHHVDGIESVSLEAFRQYSAVELGPAQVVALERLTAETLELRPAIVGRLAALSARGDRTGIAGVVAGLLALARKRPFAGFVPNLAAFQVLKRQLGDTRPQAKDAPSYRAPTMSSSPRAIELTATAWDGACLIDVAFYRADARFVLSMRDLACSESAYVRH